MGGSARTVQRVILIAGALLIILMGLFPPYALVMPAVELKGIKYPQKIIAVGYHSIFDPPLAFDPDSDGLIAKALIDRESRVADSQVADSLSKLYPPVPLQLPKRLQLVRIDVVRLAVQMATVMLAIALLAYAFRPSP
jgi:hypothetical protein